MNAPHKLHPEFRAEALRIGGEKVTRERIIEVFNPYTGDLVGTVPKASLEAHPLRARQHSRQGRCAAA